jgi:hypothetical protein
MNGLKNAKRLLGRMAGVFLFLTALVGPAAAQPAAAGRAVAPVVKKYLDATRVRVVAPAIYSSLAKAYSRDAVGLPAAELEVSTAGAPVRGFRARFRLHGYTTTWSAWEVAKPVAPGNSQKLFYRPVLDQDKLVRQTGSSPATLEVQYQYRLAGGQLVEKTVTQTVQVLGRQQMAWGALALRRGAAGSFNLFLPSYVTPEDPVVRQVAGWVSEQAGGGSYSTDDADAERFQKALYDFMAGNLTYQTPTVGGLDGSFVQYVKYPRDVLRDRSGTCIDLAIFYASVCEAVGLKPTLVIRPGHCFVAVQKPSSDKLGTKTFWTVETTGIRRFEFGQMVDLEAATRDGKKINRKEDFDKARRGVFGYAAVDVREMHAKGILALELSELRADILSVWGIHPVKAAKPAPPKAPAPGALPTLLDLFPSKPAA